MGGILKMNDDKEDRLELLAEKMIAEHDIYEGGYKFPKYTSENYIQNQKKEFFRLLKEIENVHENKNCPSTILVSQLVNSVSDYLIKISTAKQEKAELVDALRFKELAEEIIIGGLGKNLESSLEGEKIGFFVLGLNVFGSSVNEAIKSVADWIGKKEKTVSAYYHNLDGRDFWSPQKQKEFFGGEDAMRKSFIENYHVILNEIAFKYKDKPFPKRSRHASVIKTHRAYKALLGQLIAHD